MTKIWFLFCVIGSTLLMKEVREVQSAPTAIEIIIPTLISKNTHEHKKRNSVIDIPGFSTCPPGEKRDPSGNCRESF